MNWLLSVETDGLPAQDAPVSRRGHPHFRKHVFYGLSRLRQTVPGFQAGDSFAYHQSVSFLRRSQPAAPMSPVPTSSSVPGSGT